MVVVASSGADSFITEGQVEEEVAHGLVGVPYHLAVVVTRLSKAQRRRLALHCNAPLCATNCVVRMCGAPKGTPAVTRAAAARAPILMVARAAACVRARSRRKGRLLELGAGVP